MHMNGKTSPRGQSYVDIVYVPRWKRALDIGCILLAFPLLLLPALFIALLIKIVSAGPVLFKQERIGYRGRSFMCLKFRTMAVGADSLIHRKHSSGLIGSKSPMVKMDMRGDERLIPFGLLLRSSGLDELPQIINVLRGEMSLVGPRPCLRYEYDHYLPWHRERFNTLPGLTGLWQVSGKNRTTFDEMMHLDIRYTRSKSLSSDLRIMARTIPALIIQIQETHRERKGRTTFILGADSQLRTDEPSAARAGGFARVSSEQLVQSSREERK
jgi:lipopolysaccharide/colanic/teichoic acid biosynthesis glycosyltransferase